MTILPNVDMRPLADRQREMEAELRAVPKHGPQLADAVKKMIGAHMMEFMLLSAMMKRDLWEKFWAVYRDTVEQETNSILDKCEAQSAAPKTMFG